MRKPIIALLTASLVLSGCFKKEPEPEPIPPPTDQQVTVLELKQKYGETQDKAIMPLHNVSDQEEFTVKFNSYLGDLSLPEVISVHTDVKALPESRIDVDITPQSYEVGPSTFFIKPSKGVLASNKDDKTWGNAPTYFIRIGYDLDATEPTKLDKPIIIAFTLQRELDTPTLTSHIDEEGQLHLSWEPVEGATSYKVYNLSRPTLLKTSNDYLTASELGYSNLYPTLIAEVSNTQFNDWRGNQTSALIKNEKGEVTSQNDGLNGDYYVVAVNQEHESTASNLVTVQPQANRVPIKLEERINNTEHDTIRSLPKTTEVRLLDDQIADYFVKYLTEGVEINEEGYTSIPYIVEGTAFKGSVKVNKLTEYDLQTLEKENHTNIAKDYLAYQNKTTYKPSSNIPTVYSEGVEEDLEELEEGSEESSEDVEITEEGESEATEEPDTTQEEQTNEEQEEAEPEAEITPEIKEGILVQQKLATEELVAEANQETVTRPALLEVEEYELNTDTAFEEYLALSILGVKTDISLKAFPEYQNFDTLEDVVNKVLYQNPLLLGVVAWQYNYETLSIQVKYGEDESTIKTKQSNLLQEANKVKGILLGIDKIEEEVDEDGKKQVEVIIPELTEEEKREAIYNYLTDNILYWEPIEELEELVGEEEEQVEQETTEETTETNEQVEEVEEDFTTVVFVDYTPHTAYGVLVERQGTSKGYAQAYKLLSDILGLETITVTGVANGDPLVWNKVKINDSWVNIDPANNYRNTGLPYMLYQATDETAFKSNIVPDNKYWVDSELEQFRSEDKSHDYYVKNNLEIDTIEDYTARLAEKLQEGQSTIIFRTTMKLDIKRLYDVTGQLLQQYAQDKLSTSDFKTHGNYLIVTTELEEEVEATDEEVELEYSGVESDEESQEEGLEAEGETEKQE